MKPKCNFVAWTMFSPVKLHHSMSVKTLFTVTMAECPNMIVNRFIVLFLLPT